MTDARIDIALPVHNGGDTVGRTIESIRAQTHSAFRLLVSDNASSDGTRAIVARHAAEDSRITFIEQASNIGAQKNFLNLLRGSQADFFAFVAADDWWSPRFLEACLDALTKDPSVTCCVPRTGFYTRDEKLLYVSASTSSITHHSPKERIERFLIHPADCSRFYGLHRRDVLARCFTHEDEFHADDWYVVVLELIEGPQLEVPEVLLHRTEAPLVRYVKHWRRANAGLLGTRTPLQPLRRRLKQTLPPAQFRAIRGALRRLDAQLDREHRSVERRARAAAEI